MQHSSLKMWKAALIGMGWKVTWMFLLLSMGGILAFAPLTNAQSTFILRAQSPVLYEGRGGEMEEMWVRKKLILTCGEWWQIDATRVADCSVRDGEDEYPECYGFISITGDGERGFIQVLAMTDAFSFSLTRKFKGVFSRVEGMGTTFSFIPGFGLGKGWYSLRKVD